MKPSLQFATSPTKSPIASFTLFFFAPIPPPAAIDNPQSTFCLHIFFYARHFINGIIQHMVFCDWLLSFYIFYFYLFIWLFFSCCMQDFRSSLQHVNSWLQPVGYSPLTRNRTQVPCVGTAREVPWLLSLKIFKVQSHCSRYQSFISSYDGIISHCMDKPHFYLSIHQLADSWVVSSFGPLWTMLLWKFM